MRNDAWRVVVVKLQVPIVDLIVVGSSKPFYPCPSLPRQEELEKREVSKVPSIESTMPTRDCRDLRKRALPGRMSSNAVKSKHYLGGPRLTILMRPIVANDNPSYLLYLADHLIEIWESSPRVSVKRSFD